MDTYMFEVPEYAVDNGMEEMVASGWLGAVSVAVVHSEIEEVVACDE